MHVTQRTSLELPAVAPCPPVLGTRLTTRLWDQTSRRAGADAQRVAGRQRGALGDPAIVDERAVAAAQVLDGPAAVLHRDERVAPRHARVGHHEIGRAAASDDDRLV